MVANLSLPSRPLSLLIFTWILAQVFAAPGPSDSTSCSRSLLDLPSVLILDKSLSQNSLFMHFLQSNKSSYEALEKTFDPAVQDCSSLSSLLPATNSSIFLSAGPAQGPLFQASRCKFNSLGLEFVIFLSSGIFESKSAEKILNSKIFGSFFRGIEKISNVLDVNVCEEGLFDFRSGKCQNRRRLDDLNNSRTLELNETYQAYVVVMDVPGAVIMMSMEEPNEEFWMFLVKELQDYAFRNMTQKTILLASDYEVVHDAIIALMICINGTSFEGNLKQSDWDALFDISGSALFVSDPEPFSTLADFSYNEVSYYYLTRYFSRFPQQCLHSNESDFYSSVYPAALSKVFTSLSSFYNFFYSFLETSDGLTSTYSYPSIPSNFSVSVKITTKLNSLNCSCNFCLNDSEVLLIEMNLQSFGYMSDVYGFKAFIFSNKSSVGPVLTVAGNDSGSCFNLNSSVSASIPQNSSVSVFQSNQNLINGTLVSYSLNGSELSFSFSSFGLYLFVGSCPAGQGLSTDRKCVACKDECECQCSGGCSACLGRFRFNQTLSECKTCLTGYQGEKCDSCAEGFIAANSSDGFNHSLQCSQCKPGYVKTLDGDCRPCFQNCFCAIENSCDGCLDSRFDYSLNCSQCSTGYGPNGSCHACLQGFGLNSLNACEPCIAGCECKSSDTCDKCINGEQFDASQNCTLCSPGYTSGNSSKCDRCEASFGRDENGRCFPCLEGCFCEVSGTCDSCRAGPGFNKSSGCQECAEGYQSSNVSNCSVCAAGFGRSQDSLCLPCLPGCDCETTGTCSKCLNDSRLDPGSNCTKCNPRFILNNESFLCNSCAAGYSLDSTQDCQPCLEKCSCDLPGECKECLDARFDIKSNCSECIAGYTHSENRTDCGLCAGGFALDENNTCRPCQPGCLCAKASQCDECRENPRLDPYSNCSKCKPEYSSIDSNCSDCSAGFGRSTLNSSIFTCLPCVEGCNCSLFNTCDSCSRSAHLNASTHCQECETGYTSSNSTCDVCSPGFVFTNFSEQCLPCIHGCSCSTPGTCEFCLIDKHLDPSKNCTECLTGYKSSNSSVFCDLCADFYGSSNVGENSSLECQPCKTNCLCQKSATCVACKEGFFEVLNYSADGSGPECVEGQKFAELEDIYSKYMSPGFTSIDVQFKLPVLLKVADYNCSFLFVNFEVLGKDSKCAVSSELSISVQLGTDFEIDDSKALFFTKNVTLAKSKFSATPANFTVDYLAQPTIQAVVSSVQSIGLECLSDDWYSVKFSASGSFGSFRSRFQYSWTVSGAGLNFSYIETNDPTLVVNVSKVLNGEPSAALTVQLTVNDSFRMSQAQQVVTVVNNRQLKVQLDVGSSQFYRSNDIAVGSIITDPCRCEEKLTYSWQMTPSVSGVATSNSKLRIAKNQLEYGLYQVKLQVTCGSPTDSSLAGTSSTVLEIKPAALVVKTDKSDQEVSSSTSLTIRGHYSYDPDGYDLRYFWSTDFGPFELGGSSFTVPTSYFSALSTFTVTLKIETLTAVRSAEKVHKFSVMGESLSVSILSPNERISISSQSVIKSSVKSSQSKVIKYEWLLILGTVSNNYSKTFQNLVIPSNSLTTGDYSFKLTASQESVSSSATVSFKANAPPTCGSSLVVSPAQSSFAKTQKVTFSVVNCQDGDNQDYPLSFKFSIRRTNGKNSLLLVQNDGTFNDLKFPVGVAGAKVEVCDSLNDCIEKSASFSITGLSRNLKVSNEMLDYLQNKKFMNGLQAIVFALLNRITDEQLFDLLWTDLLEYVSLETDSKVIGYEVTSTVLLFVDDPQEVVFVLPRIKKFCKFLMQTMEKVDFLSQESIKYLKDFIDRVNLIDQSEASIMLTFDLVTSIGKVDWAPFSLFKFSSKNISFYQTEDYLQNIRKVHLGQTIIDLKNPGFSEDSLVQVKFGVFSSGKYSEVIYLAVSTDKTVVDSEIFEKQLQEMNNEGGCIITTAFKSLKSDEIVFRNILPDLHESAGVLLQVSKEFVSFSVSQSGVFTLGSEKSSEKSSFKLKQNFALVLTLTILSLIVIFLITLYSSGPKVANDSTETKRASNVNEKIDVSNMTEFSYIESEKTVPEYPKHLFLSVFSVRADPKRSLNLMILTSILAAQVLFQTVLMTQTPVGPLISGILSCFIVLPLAFFEIWLLENKGKKIYFNAGIFTCFVSVCSALAVSLVLDQPDLWQVAFICGLVTEILVTQNLLTLFRRWAGV